MATEIALGGGEGCGEAFLEGTTAALGMVGQKRQRGVHSKMMQLNMKTPERTWVIQTFTEALLHLLHIHCIH